MKQLITVAFFISLSSLSFSQSEDAFNCRCPLMANSSKGKMYISFGYNLDWFTPSDIHFRDRETANFDFTLYHVKAKDKPGLKNYFHQDLTIPQYSYRLGYFFGIHGQYGVELNYDHVKYVLINNQRVKLKGMINDVMYDTDTLLVEKFIMYEHTNGANYLMINGMYRHPLWYSKNELHWISAVGKYGAGVVLPRSDTNIMGKHRNDTYHVAGYVTGMDLELRYDFLKRFHAEISGKSCFANYTNIYLYGEGRAKQHWLSFEFVFTLGYQFPVKIL